MDLLSLPSSTGIGHLQHFILLFFSIIFLTLNFTVFINIVEEIIFSNQEIIPYYTFNKMYLKKGISYFLFQ